jgi:hypothetical protein
MTSKPNPTLSCGGHCRRMPPAALESGTDWPATNLDDWCGEWQGREEVTITREPLDCRHPRGHTHPVGGDGLKPCTRCHHVAGTEPCGHHHGRYGCTTQRCWYGEDNRG